MASCLQIFILFHKLSHLRFISYPIEEEEWESGWVGWATSKERSSHHTREHQSTKITAVWNHCTGLMIKKKKKTVTQAATVCFLELHNTKKNWHAFNPYDKNFRFCKLGNPEETNQKKTLNIWKDPKTERKTVSKRWLSLKCSLYPKYIFLFLFSAERWVGERRHHLSS